MEKTVKYLSVLALLGHEPLNYWPSSVAAGLVILASTGTNQEESCNNLIEVGLSYVNKNFALFSPHRYLLVTSRYFRIIYFL